MRQYVWKIELCLSDRASTDFWWHFFMNDFRSFTLEICRFSTSFFVCANMRMSECVHCVSKAPRTYLLRWHKESQKI